MHQFLTPTHSTLRDRPVAPLPRVLLVEAEARGDDAAIWDHLRAGWAADVELLRVATIDAACRVLHAPGASCVLLDLAVSGDGSLAGLTRLRDQAPGVPVVVIADAAQEPLALQAINAGAVDYLLRGRVDDRLVARAVRYAVERKRSESQLRHQALHDSLTGLPNRGGFLEALRAALGRPYHARTEMAVLFVALDRFTIVNESLGHEAGDRLLTLVAGRLASVLRDLDVVARFGGDEFTVLCEDVLDEAGAAGVCERLAEAIAAPFAIEGREVFLTASVGIAMAGRDATALTAEALVRDASSAARRAKANGRAHHTLFDEVMRTHAVARLETINALHRALERNELRIHYQPTVCLRDGQVRGVEALLRWEHPERGLIPPGEFIPLAEETGLIEDIGRWVLGEACAQLAHWRSVMPPRHHRPPLVVSVNLSARQLQQPAIVDVVAGAVARAGIPAHALVLELTESLLVTDDPKTRATFAALRSLGVRLAIDDFGTGYASLAALRHFPADVIKIDRTFVSGVGSDPVDTAIVSAVIGLTHDLGLLALAEGVERREQVDALRGLGCDVVQGFLFARALPAEEIAALLHSGFPL